MRNKLRSEELAIEVPTAAQDKPAWVKVGVIAAVGFVIGIAWPRIAGVRIGPNAPGESAAAASASHGGRAPDAPPASVTKQIAPTPSASVASAPSQTASPPAGAAPPSITVSKGLVLTCKTTDGENKKGKDCGAVPGVDEIVRPRVRKIATCSGMEGQTGKFSLTANADFVSGRFWYEVNTKSATVQNLDAVQSCLKTVFHNTATTATPHEHNRYTVVYTAQLAPGADDKDKVADKSDKGDKADKGDSKAKAEPADDKPSEKSDKPATPTATGEAEVGWDVGLVRDTPKTGALVARLPRGTKVKVGASKDGWYQVKYGDGFANEGWLYRGAIGR
ncbi:MAG: SH3 domain-containing protein [Labilithrix sp.]